MLKRAETDPGILLPCFPDSHLAFIAVRSNNMCFWDS